MVGVKSRRAGKTARPSKAKAVKGRKASQAKKNTKSKTARRMKVRMKVAKATSRRAVKAIERAVQKAAKKTAKKPSKKAMKRIAKKAVKRADKEAARNVTKGAEKKSARELMKKTVIRLVKPTKILSKEAPRKASPMDVDQVTKPAKRVAVNKASRGKRAKKPEAASIADLLPHQIVRKSGPTEAELRREVLGMPVPTMDLTHPDRVGDLMYLTCFRGRKFGRSRFSRLVLERIAATDASHQFVAAIPVEIIALFFAREVRPVRDDRAPVNECFELPDGGLLEFVGDHMDAAEHVARLLLAHDEARLDHIVELLTEHDRSWLHTLAIESRDARLTELGFLDLDDVGRLFASWHSQLLIRKLQASIEASAVPRVILPRAKVTAEAVLDFARALPDPSRQTALDRMHFLALCQAIHDTKRMIRRMTPASLNQSAAMTLRIIAQGIREAGGDMTLIDGPQVSTVYRLGLSTLG